MADVRDCDDAVRFRDKGLKTSEERDIVTYQPGIT